MKMKLLRAVALPLLFAVTAVPYTLAETSANAVAASDQLTEEDRAAVVQLNEYLNAIDTMSGEFTQTSPRGQVANGIFYIAKPGKMRFEYAPPSPLVVISDGSWVTVQNTKRNNLDQYPLSATPLKLVLANDVNLFEQAVILDIKSEDDVSMITLQEKNQLVAGKLTMIFNRATNELVQWVVVDGKGQQTSVQLANVQIGVEADPQLFAVKRNRERTLDPSR